MTVRQRINIPSTTFSFSFSFQPFRFLLKRDTMLDIKDFVAERGGNPDKVRESQRRRGEPVETVDKVIKQYQDHRKGCGVFCLGIH